MTNATPIVVAENLAYDYGPRRALDGVSFALDRGEVLGLLGPNGSGKSTCLRLVTGYLCPTAGRVRVMGLDPARDGAQARRHIGYVQEDAALYPHLRVDEFLRLMGRLRRCTGARLETECARVRARLALDDVRRLPIGKLSRGYRQRVAIAQALLGAPDLLILDEPTNGLDPWQIIELRQLVTELAQRHALLVTSHVLAEIEQVATRALILNDGRLRATVTVNTNSPGALERAFLMATGR